MAALQDHLNSSIYFVGNTIFLFNLFEESLRDVVIKLMSGDEEANRMVLNKVRMHQLLRMGRALVRNRGGEEYEQRFRDFEKKARAANSLRNKIVHSVPEFSEEDDMLTAFSYRISKSDGLVRNEFEFSDELAGECIDTLLEAKQSLIKIIIGLVDDDIIEADLDRESAQKILNE